jgi:hypothetical protein
MFGGALIAFGLPPIAFRVSLIAFRPPLIAIWFDSAGTLRGSHGQTRVWLPGRCMDLSKVMHLAITGASGRARHRGQPTGRHRGNARPGTGASGRARHRGERDGR